MITILHLILPLCYNYVNNKRQRIEGVAIGVATVQLILLLFLFYVETNVGQLNAIDGR